MGWCESYAEDAEPLTGRPASGLPLAVAVPRRARRAGDTPWSHTRCNGPAVEQTVRCEGGGDARQCFRERPGSRVATGKLGLGLTGRLGDCTASEGSGGVSGMTVLDSSLLRPMLDVRAGWHSLTACQAGRGHGHSAKGLTLVEYYYYIYYIYYT
jgi:hypothetical protein